MINFIKLPNGEPDETLVAIVTNLTALIDYTEALQDGSSVADYFEITRAAVSAPLASKQAIGLMVAIDTTEGNYDTTIRVPETGTLSAITLVSKSTLATSDTNFVTFSVTNLGQAGAGSTVMLAATDANTTKATGGSAVTVNVGRDLTLTSTAANLAVTKGDILRVRGAVTGTLANAIDFAFFTADFAGTT